MDLAAVSPRRRGAAPIAPPVRALALLVLLLVGSGVADGARAQDRQHRAADPGTPDDPADSFTLAEGLEIEVWAETPQLRNPTNIDVDEEGRIWAVEAVDYRGFNNPPEDRLARARGERIVILEDTNGDGRADSSKVFVEDPNLTAPLGIAVFGNRVVVSAAPSVYVYTDTDGDDRPEKKDVLLSGFGGTNHDHAVHAVTAGPDGRWYLNAGNAGPHVVTDRDGWILRAGGTYHGGSPYHTYNQGGLRSSDGAIYAGGVALSIRPDGGGMEVLSHNYRNAYDLAVDSYGSLWTNDNDDEVRTCRTAWVMEGSSAGYFNADGTRFWHEDRRPGQHIFTAHWHQEDPGVLPAGDRTGAGAPTGITVYEGDALGDRFRGWVLSADAGRNAVFGYPGTRKGAGYAMDRQNFLRSVQTSTAGYVWHEIREDPAYWFRPSDVAVGTDGAIYVADWYDPVVGGHAMRDTTGFGRIYRITPTDEELRAPEIDLSTLEGQLAALRSPAPNVRHEGFRRLRRRGSSAIEAVRPLLEAENPYHRARAIWLLAQLGENGRGAVERLLTDSASGPAADPDLRVAAFRALRAEDALSVPLLQKMASDSSPAVRREVSLALADRPLREIEPVLLELAQRYPNGGDRWYLEALGQAAEGRESAVYERLRAELAPGLPEEWPARFADLAWRLHPPEAIAAWSERARSEGLDSNAHTRALTALGFTEHPEAAGAMRDLATSGPDSTARLAHWWLEYREQNDWHTYLDATLREAGFRAPADPIARRMELESWATDESRGPAVRAEAAEELSREPAGARRVIRLVRAGELSPSTLDSVRTAIFEAPDPTVRALADHYLGRPDGSGEGTGRSGVSPAEVLARTGERAAGHQLFFNSCANCHTFRGEGHAAGLDLTRRAPRMSERALVEAIVRPGEVLAGPPRPVEVVTERGETYYGFVEDPGSRAHHGVGEAPDSRGDTPDTRASTGDTLVLRGAMGQPYRIPASEIVRRTRLETGLMSAPAELGLDAQDVADIRAFLQDR